MRHKEVIYLISVTITYDEIGNPIETITERKVYANERAVGSTDFYNAAVTGLRPSRVFEIYSFEYKGEERLKHNGVTYRIIQAPGKGEKVYLTCEKVAADG